MWNTESEQGQGLLRATAMRMNPVGGGERAHDREREGGLATTSSSTSGWCHGLERGEADGTAILKAEPIGLPNTWL